MNVTIIRNLLIGIALICKTAIALGNDQANVIADHIGDLNPPAATVTSMAAAMSTVGLYAGAFRYADHLDDASWVVVQEQMIKIYKLIDTKAEQAARESNRGLHSKFLAELSKVDPKHLSELAIFLDSPHGKAWLQANNQYAEDAPNAFLFAAEHTIASRRRGESLRTKAVMPRSGPGQIPAILVLHAAIFSPGNEPSLYVMLSGIPLLGVANPKLTNLANDAAQALSDGMKAGLSSAAFLALTKSFTATVRSPQTTINMFALKLDNIEPPVKARMQDLVARSSAAMNGAQTNRCQFSLRDGTLQSIGTDVGNIMSGKTSIKPGTVEHTWVANSFERGCLGKKDFPLALKVWEDVAAAGNVHVYCTISEYYRLGIGITPNADIADQWEKKFVSTGRASSCNRMAFNPEKPWVGLAD